MNKCEQDLLGKVYVVTGGNSGIGFEAARNFAARGARLVLICRSEQRGRAALAKIESETGNDQGLLYVADFSSLESVSAVADRLLREFLKIDVLCITQGQPMASAARRAKGLRQRWSRIICRASFSQRN